MWERVPTNRANDPSLADGTRMAVDIKRREQLEQRALLLGHGLAGLGHGFGMVRHYGERERRKMVLKPVVCCCFWDLSFICVLLF